MCVCRSLNKILKKNRCSRYARKSWNTEKLIFYFRLAKLDHNVIVAFSVGHLNSIPYLNFLQFKKKKIFKVDSCIISLRKLLTIYGQTIFLPLWAFLSFIWKINRLISRRIQSSYKDLDDLTSLKFWHRKVVLLLSSNTLYSVFEMT